MESDLRQRRHLLHPHRPPPLPTTAGLTRFRSAPSSFFESLLESCEEFLNRPSSPETERMLTRLISDDDIAGDFPAPGGINSNQLSQFTKNIKSETETLQNNGGNNNNSYGGGGGGFGGGPASQNYYQNSSHPPPLPSRKIGNGGSGLIRQSSSPAGLFSDINIENGSYGAGMGGSNGAVTPAFPPPTNRFGSPMNYSSVSSGMTSSMAPMMSPIAETGHMRIIASELLVQDNNSTTTESSFSQGNPSQQEDDFTADFSWDDAQSYSPSLKRARLREDQSSNFSRSNSSEVQNDEEFGRPPSMLAHHLSLPNTSAVDKFLELQDTTVPWRIRAKRGCATHPRSIAERVRRTRISERMRKLQDLVPNMDKQTNTSDMLDFAVEHIKDLQKQLKMLSASRASCRCQQ